MKKIGVVEIWVDDEKTANFPDLAAAEVQEGFWEVVKDGLRNLVVGLYGVVEAQRPDAAQVLGKPGSGSDLVRVDASFATAGVDNTATPDKSQTWKVTWEPGEARYTLPPDV